LAVETMDIELQETESTQPLLEVL